MPLFMDVHEQLPEGAGFEDVVGAHEADLATQERLRRGVPAVLGRRGGRQGVLPGRGAEPRPPRRVHREAHGLVADRIYQVREG